MSPSTTTDPVRAAFAAAERAARAEMAAEVQAAYAAGYERGWMAGYETAEADATTPEQETPDWRPR